MLALFALLACHRVTDLEHTLFFGWELEAFPGEVGAHPLESTGVSGRDHDATVQVEAVSHGTPWWKAVLPATKELDPVGPSSGPSPVRGTVGGGCCLECELEGIEVEVEVSFVGSVAPAGET